MGPPRLTFAGITAAAALLLTPSADAAGSRPPVVDGALFSDPAGDSGGAPDLREITPFADDGRFGARIALGSNDLRRDDEILTFLDADGDGETGPDFGADALVSVFVLPSGELGGALGIWVDSIDDYADVPSADVEAFRSGEHDVVWTVAAEELGLEGRASITLAAASTDLAYPSLSVDWAPDGEPGGPIAFTGPVGRLSGAWPPFVPPPPSPPAAPPPPSPAAPIPPLRLHPPPPMPYPLPFGIPRERTRRVSLPVFGVDATRRGVRLVAGWRHGAGRVTWTLRLESRLGRRRLTRTLRGSGPAGPEGATVRRTMRLPPAWRGAGVRVRFTAVNGTRTITRVRMVRIPRR